MRVADDVERIVPKPALELLDRLGGSAERYQVMKPVVEARRRGNRIVRHRQAETARRLGPIVAVHGRHDAEHGVGFCQRRIELDGTLRVRARQRHGLVRRPKREADQILVQRREPAVCHRELRVERDRFFQVSTADLEFLRKILRQEMPRLQVCVVRRRPGQIAPRRWSTGQPRFQGGTNRVGDVILHCEDIRELTVEPLGPQMTAIGRGDELRGHAKAVARPADAALENVVTPSASAIRRTSVFCPLKANADVRAMTLSPGIWASALIISSARPSPKYSLSLPGLMSANGSTAIDGSNLRRLRRKLLQGRPHFGHRLKPAAPDPWPGIAERCDRARAGLERPGFVTQDAANPRRGVAPECAASAEHLVEHRAKAEDVRARVERSALRLLG